MTSIPNESQAPRPNNSWVKWIFIGCGAFLLMGIAFGVVLWMFVTRMTAAPEKVVKDFLAAAAAGDYAAAHGHFSAPLKQEQPLEEFTTSARENSQFFDVTHTSFSKREIDMSGAELAGTVTLKSGTKLPARFKLVKEGEQWKLLAYNIGS